MKSANIIDRSDEIEELRKRLDRITATMKSSNFKGSKPKKERKESPSGSGSNSSRNKKEDIRKNLLSGYHADTLITIKAEPSMRPTAAFINIHEHPL